MERARIESRQNETVKRLRALMRDAAFRREAGEYVCEGFKLYSEAERYGEIASVFVADRAEGFDISGPAPVYSLPDRLFDYVSGQENSQGLLFCCRIKRRELPDQLSGRYMLLDGVSDPGNMGTIIRTADAFAVDGLILCGSCVDVYNPKVVRGAMGSLFRMPVYQAGYAEILSLIKRSGIPFYRAHARENALPLGSIALQEAVVAVGNEANGISGELCSAEGMDIIIPMAGKAESLNVSVAASIIMWEMSKA